MKQSEINTLTDADLNETLENTKKKFNELKLAHTLSPLDNPLQIKSHRRTIARLHTEISKRKLS